MSQIDAPGQKNPTDSVTVESWKFVMVKN